MNQNIHAAATPIKSRDPITSFRDRVVRVDPRDPIAVSKARAAIADRYDAKSQRRRTAPSSRRNFSLTSLNHRTIRGGA
jgi:hypothetical protein